MPARQNQRPATVIPVIVRLSVLVVAGRTVLVYYSIYDPYKTHSDHRCLYTSYIVLYVTLNEPNKVVSFFFFSGNWLKTSSYRNQCHPRTHVSNLEGGFEFLSAVFYGWYACRSCYPYGGHIPGKALTPFRTFLSWSVGSASEIASGSSQAVAMAALVCSC